MRKGECKAGGITRSARSVGSKPPARRHSSSVAACRYRRPTPRRSSARSRPRVSWPRAACARSPSSTRSCHEIGAGALEGMNEVEIRAAHPPFMHRPLRETGDFADYGGESYDDVQARVGARIARLEARHRDAEDRVLLVGHGGFHYQLMKTLLCEPVPARVHREVRQLHGISRAPTRTSWAIHGRARVSRAGRADGWHVG